MEEDKTICIHWQEGNYCTISGEHCSSFDYNFANCKIAPEEDQENYFE